MNVQSNISDIFEKYLNAINNIDSLTWNGASKDHLVTMSAEFVKQYDGTIYGQLSNLSSALANYEAWLEAKRAYNKYKTYADSCSGTTEESANRKAHYVKEANKCAAQMNNLASAIKVALASIKGENLYGQPTTSGKGQVIPPNNGQVVDNNNTQVTNPNNGQDVTPGNTDDPSNITAPGQTIDPITGGVIDPNQTTDANEDQKEFVKYFKEDYANDSYGDGTTIASAGSGPTAMAMVVATLTDKEITPVDAANWSLDHGYRCYGNGTYWSYFDAYAQANGLSCTQTNINNSSIISSLKAGDPVIVSVGPGSYTDSGHFVVLTGLTSDGKVSIVDPNSRIKSESTYDLDLFLREGTQQWVIK